MAACSIRRFHSRRSKCGGNEAEKGQSPVEREFTGVSRNKMDGKGRVSIPVKFRRVLQNCDTEYAPGGVLRMHVTFGDPTKKFIECWSANAYGRLLSRISRMKSGSAEARIMAIDEARKSGAMMLFGEKYGDEVRVLAIGSSTELCGGTHVARIGDIGLLKIIGESGVAAGVRRVEAVCGDVALAWLDAQQDTLMAVTGALKAQPQEVVTKVGQMVDHVKALEKELARLKSKLASSQGDDLAAQAVDIKGIKVLAALLEGADVATLPPAVLRQLVQHPLTDKGLAAFLADWEATGQRIV